MKPTKQNNQAETQSQALTEAQVQLKMFMMQKSGDYPALTQEYLANKLKRDQSAIAHAFGGKSPKLLRRINKHLNWLEAQRAKKQQSIAV